MVMGQEVRPAESAMVKALSDRRMSLREELRACIAANTELKRENVVLENRVTRDLRASARRLAEAREEVAELRATLAALRAELAALRGEG